MKDTEAVDPKSPRAVLHHAVRREFSQAMMTYFRSNPEYMFDERGRKLTSALLGLMHEVLGVLDQFDISRKKEGDCE